MEQFQIKLKYALKIRKFRHKFGYIPKDLEIDNIDILELQKGSLIGPRNKIKFTHFPVLEDNNASTTISLGRYCWTGSNVELNTLTGSSIIIKDFTTIQDNCKLIGDITIEKYTLLAPSVFISSGRHYAVKGVPDIIRNQDQYHLSNLALLREHSIRVHIEEDCWIGIGSYIKAGVYIGRGAIIGAHAVVNKDVPPYSIIGGVPAKRIDARYEFNPPLKIDASETSHKVYFYRGFNHKNNESTISLADHIEMGQNTGVVVTKKGNIKNIIVCGKMIGDNSKPLEVSLVFNGEYQYAGTINMASDGSFVLKAARDEFHPINNQIEDYVFRLRHSYNLFNLKVSLPKIAGKRPFVAIKYFETEII